MFSSSNKRRSIFFGGGNSNNNASSKENIAPKKSTFKTFSVVHVNDTEQPASKQERPVSMVRKSSSQYKSRNIPEEPSHDQNPSLQAYKTLRPSGSILSKRPPPPTLDINSIYDTIQRHESQSGNKDVSVIEEDDDVKPQSNLMVNTHHYNDNSSSVYVETPTTLQAPPKKVTSALKENFDDSFDSKITTELNNGDDVQSSSLEYMNFVHTEPNFDEVSAKDNEHDDTTFSDDLASYTQSVDYVGNHTENGNDNAEQDGESFEYEGFSNTLNEHIDDSINDDFIVSNNYTMKQPASQGTGILNEFTKRHNREKSELEEYLEELEDFRISDAESGNYTTESNMLNNTINMNSNKRNSLVSDASSLVYGTTGGLKVVNVESSSEDVNTDITPENESISYDENSMDSFSDSSSFLEKHSQLSAVKSLYHSDNGAWLEQGSVPSLPFTIENNDNTFDSRYITNDEDINEARRIDLKNSMPTMATEGSNYMDSLSGDHYSADHKSMKSVESSIHFVPPESKYISKLLHKHPTANKKTFKFDLPLNLLKNPAEDVNAKTAVLKNPRKSKNIKHKTEKKKLLSNEEPTPMELLKTKNSAFGMHMNVKEGSHRMMASGLGDIDEEERFILQQLPGSEGYMENSLASKNNAGNRDENKYSTKRQVRNRSDTVKSYYTRNANRLRAETISTIDTMNNVNLEGLQITNPDSD